MAANNFRTRCLQLALVAWLPAMPTRASFTVLDYWRMGENDPAAVSGGGCTNTIDVIGGRTLTNTPSLSAYPTYTNDVAATAAADTGSQLALQMSGGQSAIGTVIAGVTDNFGIELWARPATTASGTRVLAYNGNTSFSGWGIFQSGAAYLGLFGGVAIFASGPATSNVWTHLALVRASGTTTLYVNGVSAGSVAIAPNTPAGSFLIGVNNIGGENFVGALDEVRVFTFGAGEFNVTNLLYSQIPSFTLSATNFSVGASAGTNSLTLTVSPTNVSWTATANASWLHVVNGSGTGNGTVTFTVDDNPWVGRSGTLIVGGQTVTVTQGTPSYSLNGNYDFYWTGDVFEEPSTAGSDSISISVTPNAGTWSVSSYASWIHPTPSGTGSGTINFTFDANTDPGGAARAGQVYINNAANSLLRFIVFQQGPPSGTGQATYHFTGNLLAYLPEYTPANASTALKSVQNNDVFYLDMTLVPSTVNIYYEVWPCAVNNIRFSVPSRGLVYTQAFDDLEVLHDANNPNTLRWDVNGVDSTVNMIFWARDFNQTALTSGSVPYPLDLSGFHANGFAQLILYNGVGANPTLFYGNLVPTPGLSIHQQNQTTRISWVTSDSFYAPVLQTSSALGPSAVWTLVTNPPAITGLTNVVTLPAATGAQFFRLKVL